MGSRDVDLIEFESRVVLDANVVVRAFVAGHEEARTWLAAVAEGRAEGLAPDLIYAETASALRRYVRVGRILLERAVAVMNTFVDLPFSVTPCRRLAPASCSLAIQRGLTVYDAHYLALAEVEDAVLVTADRALAAAASRSILLD
jgi:predicted nucleic acid-binding protein